MIFSFFFSTDVVKIVLKERRETLKKASRLATIDHFPFDRSSKSRSALQARGLEHP